MKTLTPEQFKGRYGDVSFNAPQVKGGPVTVEPEKPKRSWMEKTLGFLGGEKLAQGAGQAIAQPFISKTVNEIQGGQGEMQQKLMAAIQKGRALGQDTSRLNTALRNLTNGEGGIANTGEQAAGLYNPNNLTTKQVVGDALQLGATIASVGTYGSAASGAKTGVLLRKAPTVIAKTIAETGFKKGAIAGAKAGILSGAGYGATAGVAQGLKEDLNAGEIVKKGFTNLVQGGLVGGVVGGLVGGISGSLRARTLRRDIIKAQTKGGSGPDGGGGSGRPSLSDTIKSKIKDFTETTPEREAMKPTLDDVVKGRIKVDEKFAAVIKEAQKQGLDEADINLLANASKQDKKVMNEMFDASVSRLSSKKGPRAADILGKSVTDKVVQVQKINNEQGALVDKAARALKGQTVDASAVLNRADEVLSNAGVTVGNDGSLNFTKSIFKKSPEIQKRIAKALSDIPLGEIDGYELHKFKKSIDEVVKYGTTGEGLKGNSANILKSIRNSADEVLDGAFESYNVANTNYKYSRDFMDIAKSMVNKNIDINSREGSIAFGQSLRALFSQRASRGKALEFIENTHLIGKKLGLEGSGQNLLDQALFVDFLEGNFGSEATTGLAGEITKSLNSVKTVAGAVRSPKNAALEGIAHVIEKSQHISPEDKRLVIKSFLNLK